MVWDKQKQQASQRKSYLKHREKRREGCRQWLKANKEKAKNNFLRSHYGISLQEYNEMLIKQGQCCAICRGQQKQKSRWGGKLSYFCVDHDHTTLAVRGLLCKRCNTAIGFLQNDPMVVYAAFRYLVKAKLPIRR